MTLHYQPTKKDKERYKGMSVCVLIPCGSYEMSATFVNCLSNMLVYSWMHGLKIHQVGHTERMVVDWARNDLARRATKKICEYTDEHFTHFLWLDDDHAFSPDLALWLAREDKDMVSALYFGRTDPHYPVVYVKDNSGDKYKHFPLLEVPTSLIEVDAVGFGALMMRRDVFKRVPEPWFTVDYKAGEDIAFCVKAKEHGVKVYCDGRYKLGHIGPPPIVTEETYLAAQKNNPDIFNNKVKVGFNG